LAADALGATPMDRPEDVQPNAKSGKIYVMLTNNYKRRAGKVNAANPRSRNLFGHVIEMSPPDQDHAADTFRWDILLKAGNPDVGFIGAQWHPQTSESGWFASPDNCTIDADGRLWIATDQGKHWGLTGKADGLYAVETDGDLRGLSRLFFRVPVGAEMCGPCFTPDNETLFLSVQHPGADGAKTFKSFGGVSTYDTPVTRWPDFKPDMPPRPSIVAVRRSDGKRIT
jgi:secreted PhoX family phosphatase